MIGLRQWESATKQIQPFAFLKALTLFVGLSDQEIALFTDVAKVKTYKKGHTLYSEGDEAKFFYIIRDGWVKLFHVTEDGEEVNLGVITKGSMLGKSAIFENNIFNNNAQIVEAAEIVSIPLSLLKEQIQNNQKIAYNMLNSMVQHQREHEMQFEQYFLYSAPQRIGCFLLGLCPTLEQVDGVMLNLPYDKTLIASTLGMKGATFSRALNLLRTETGIQIEGTAVVIASMSRLLKFVDGCYSHHHLISKI